VTEDEGKSKASNLIKVLMKLVKHDHYKGVVWESEAFGIIADELLEAFKSGRKSASGTLPHTHGDTICATTPDGKEWIESSEVDHLLEEAEDRVLADICMRTGLAISRESCTDGVNQDGRPVPMYSLLNP